MAKRVRKSDYNPGDFGYRTRDRRSGLDPIENQLEFGRAQGIFIRKLFTGHLRTGNPFYLFLMSLLAIILLYLTAQIFFNPSALFYSLPYLLCMGSVGLALLVNIFLSVPLIISNLYQEEEPERPRHKHRD